MYHKMEHLTFILDLLLVLNTNHLIINSYVIHTSNGIYKLFLEGSNFDMKLEIGLQSVLFYQLCLSRSFAHLLSA